jgi:hypothetical protein
MKKYGASILLLFVSTLTLAETIATSRQLVNSGRTLTYLTSETVKDSLITASKKWDETLGYQCADSYSINIDPNFIVVLKAIEFPEESLSPQSGIWQYRFSANRCGGSKTYNVLAYTNKTGMLGYKSLVPGSTAASPILMTDTLKAIYSKVTLETKVKENKECNDFVVIDTQMTKLPSVSLNASSSLISGPYEESWTVRYCGKEMPIPMCFIPKPDGGSSFFTSTCKELSIK